MREEVLDPVELSGAESLEASSSDVSVSSADDEFRDDEKDSLGTLPGPFRAECLSWVESVAIADPEPWTSAAQAGSESLCQQRRLLNAA